jgi:hypothetical protein
MTRRVSVSLIIATIVVAAAILMLATMGRAVAGLVATLGVAYVISLRPIAIEQLRGALPAYVAAIAVQGAHLIEEYRTGFYAEFPRLLGASPWSGGAFLRFNLAWLVIFGVGAGGLTRGWQLAVVIALFLALGAGVLNGLGHLVLAARIGAYFPGLYTAPLVLCAGSYLAFRLLRHQRARQTA